MANGPKGAGGISWTVLFAGAAVLMSLSSGVLSIFNPKSDITDLKKDLADFKWQVSQDYIRKDLAIKELNHAIDTINELKRNKAEADLLNHFIADVDRRQAFQRNRLEKLESTLTSTYSTRDAVQLMQTQIIDLQKSLHPVATIPLKAP